ncbi:MAG: GTPase [Candidatus Woesearchaeota archaeon]
MIYDYDFFKKIAYFPEPKIIIDRAFKSAKKSLSNLELPSKKELVKLKKIKHKIFVNIFVFMIDQELNEIISKLPNFNELSGFYRDLISAKFDFNQIKLEIRKIKFTIKKIKEFKKIYLEDYKKYEEFIGRTTDLVENLSDTIEYLNSFVDYVHSFPNLKYLPTIALAGYPNVGKSSFLRYFTKADVEVQDYAFTTKRLQIGYVQDLPALQIVDAPGMLDRPFEEMNFIEKQAYLVLKYATAVFFIFDPGLDHEKQLNLLRRVKEIKDVYIIVNKIDLYPEFKWNYDNALGIYYISLSTGKNCEEVYNLMKKIFYENYKTYK